MESEVNVLRTGLKDIEKELDHHKNLPSQMDGRPDKFVTVMKNFVTVAAYNFSELEDSLKEMKTKVTYTDNDIETLSNSSPFQICPKIFAISAVLHVP